MPGFDRTGPGGRGPMTGWGRGYCISGDWPERPRYGWGGGMGRARGWRHRFWATGVPGCGRWAAPFDHRAFTPEEELEDLNQEVTYLEKELNTVRRQIEKMTKAQSTSGKEE